MLSKKELDMFAVKEFGMFTTRGNAAIGALVSFAKVAELTWSETYNMMRLLADSNPEYYGEAMDTVVRESVYCAIGADTRNQDFYC
jgi:hypothetical protein